MQNAKRSASRSAGKKGKRSDRGLRGPRERQRGTPREGRERYRPSGDTERPALGCEAIVRKEESLKMGDDEIHSVEISIARKIEDAEHAPIRHFFFFFHFKLVY